MTGHERNSEVCFPWNLDVSQDEVEGNIKILGKQNSLFPSGPVINCLMYYCYLPYKLFVAFFPNLLVVILINMARKGCKNRQK